MVLRSLGLTKLYIITDPWRITYRCPKLLYIQEWKVSLSGQSLGKVGPDVQAIMEEWVFGITYLGENKRSLPLKELEDGMHTTGDYIVPRFSPLSFP